MKFLAVVLASLLLLACGQVAPAPLPTSPSAAPVGSARPHPTSPLPASCHIRGQLPDLVCTPGVADPRVTQANIASTICVSGYTRTVRPPVAYTDHLKRIQMMQYGFTDSISAHEEDHLISLELGGAPADPMNLWPEPGRSPNPKDRVENRLHAAVCAGTMTLAAAQRAIATDWTRA